ncbi:unnamed protein product, partial [Polarella glacialis]
GLPLCDSSPGHSACGVSMVSKESASSVPVALGSCFVALVTAAALRLGWRRAAVSSEKGGHKYKMSRKSSGMLRRCASSKEVVATSGDSLDLKDRQAHGVPWYATPADASESMWHKVDLTVRDWLDEDTGLFRYVNEMPLGALQKFEVQTTLATNVIREDAKGSRKLQAFGKPVPFNYGCFPQTYRDPQERDDIYDAPGDDDPLDVIDLSPQVVGVGKIACCRPLGAVCLIDEGQADWKIIVVNTELEDPLASARSIEEAERIAPGRIEKAL